MGGGGSISDATEIGAFGRAGPQGPGGPGSADMHLRNTQGLELGQCTRLGLGPRSWEPMWPQFDLLHGLGLAGGRGTQRNSRPGGCIKCRVVRGGSWGPGGSGIEGCSAEPLQAGVIFGRVLMRFR